jgi:hypothetical protein
VGTSLKGPPVSVLTLEVTRLCKCRFREQPANAGHINLLQLIAVLYMTG